MENSIIERPTIEVYFNAMAKLVATRATCPRRQVGCVLVNKRNHVLATGYNGVASGQKHCIEHNCPGVNLPSGVGLDKCEAIHAEQNALLQCSDVYAIHACYVTVSPCITCIKLLLNTSCQHIFFSEEYVNIDAKKLWTEAGRFWNKV